MTKAEIRKLETILARVETLQLQTNDVNARGRLGQAKTELLRLLGESSWPRIRDGDK